jgi:hypothetical protein
MTETTAPARPRRRLKWLLIAACLLLLAGSGWLYFLLTGSGGDAFYRLVKPGGAVSRSFGPILVEVAPESAQDGMAVKYLSTSSELEQTFFVSKERNAVKIKVTAGREGVERDGLSYTILGQNDEKLSQGKVSLTSSLKPGESGQGEIIDLQIPNGRRIVIGK